jgi:GT2 family glycosyltransferase
MKLSIIIVNFNVRYFLEQCLTSVLKATNNIDAEIFVVDNESKDDSVEMVQTLFPTVKVIANKKNVGFSKANNQAIGIAKGEYVLLLNPDTVVEEDTFEKCIAFMDNHPKAGGLGVKMIDGNGIFLPESKRGLPTPSVSFYKIFGLSSLFPKSRTFSKYHLGYLSNDETNEIEILSGAFMWMRKSVLDEIGYLDESFFMYGEDIDLSYRIIKAGYQNYYFPETKIIHYKGESTKKGSINYVFVFYNAMIIFSKKHFAQKAKAFSFFINIAIYLRAFLAIIVRFINFLKLPIIDVVIMSFILGVLNFLKPFIYSFFVK